MNDTPRKAPATTLRNNSQDTENAYFSNVEYPMNDTMNNIGTTYHERHTSGYQVSTTDFVASKVAIPLPDHWLPEENAIEELKGLGFDQREIVDYLSRFKSYYQESGDISKAWNNKFVEWCLRSRR